MTLTDDAVALGWPRSGIPRIKGIPPGRYVPPGFAMVAPAMRHLGLLGPWGFWVNNVHMISWVRPILSFRDWELIALRATWNAGGFPEWNYHQIFQRVLGDSAHLIRLKQGPAAAGWNDKQSALLAAVDELHDHLAVSETTWARLAPYLDDQQRAELCIVTGMYELLSLVFGSLGQPTDLPLLERRASRRVSNPAWGPRRPRAGAPLAPTAAGHGVTVSEAHDPWLPYDPAIYDLLATHHPRTRRLLDRVSSLMARRSKLAAADRDLAILRTTWRCGPATEWAIRSQLAPAAAELAQLGPSAAGASERQAAVLGAVDELDAAYFISDQTWLRLAEHLDQAQLIELCLLVGHYRVVAMLMNSFRESARQQEKP